MIKKLSKKFLDANSSFISVNARNGAATVREPVWTKRKGISETGDYVYEISRGEKLPSHATW